MAGDEAIVLVVIREMGCSIDTAAHNNSLAAKANPQRSWGPRQSFSVC